MTTCTFHNKQHKFNEVIFNEVIFSVNNNNISCFFNDV